MSDDSHSPNGSGARSWLGRLGQVLTGEPRDRDELIAMLRDAQQRGLLDSDAESMIEGVLQVTEMQVRDIMIPRAQMTVVERDDSLDEILPVIIESGYSRFPVVSGNKDEVVGVLIAKDLLRFCTEDRRRSFNIRETLRPPTFIPESKRLNVLLKDFRLSRNHIAIVVDEYGGVAGMVTIEDVLEQIVGEIDDEHDIEEDSSILKYSDSRFLVKALTDIEDFNEYFDASFSDDEFDTVGGVLMHAFGHVPKRGETIELGGFRFTVLRADNRRIHLVQVTPQSVAAEPSTPSESA